MKKIWTYIVAAFTFLFIVVGYLWNRKKEAEALLQNADTKQKDLDLQKDQLKNASVIATEEALIKSKEQPKADPNATKDEVEDFWRTK